MGQNPSILVIGQSPRLDTILRSLLQITDSSSRSRLAAHLPWQPAKCIKNGEATIGVGIRGWHGFAGDTHNCSPFALRLRGTLVPCDLSIYCGDALVLIELCAATNAGADTFVADVFGAKTFVSHVGPVAEAICYDNEHDPWTLLYPASSDFLIPWTLAEMEAYQLHVPGSDPVIDIDAFGEVLLEMVSPT